VAARCGLAAFEQAWQSAGRTPEPWLGPSLEEKLAALAEEGRRRVLVAPIGFVCDHTEILYDVDVQAQAAARERGLALRRTESLNTSAVFIRALGGVVRRAWS
jgi:ferrochelatase